MSWQEAVTPSVLYPSAHHSTSHTPPYKKVLSWGSPAGSGLGAVVAVQHTHTHTLIFTPLYTFIHTVTSEWTSGEAFPGSPAASEIAVHWKDTYSLCRHITYTTMFYTCTHRQIGPWRSVHKVIRRSSHRGKCWHQLSMT